LVGLIAAALAVEVNTGVARVIGRLTVPVSALGLKLLVETQARSGCRRR